MTVSPLFPCQLSWAEPPKGVQGVGLQDRGLVSGLHLGVTSAEVTSWTSVCSLLYFVPGYFLGAVGRGRGGQARGIMGVVNRDTFSGQLCPYRCHQIMLPWKEASETALSKGHPSKKGTGVQRRLTLKVVGGGTRHRTEEEQASVGEQNQVCTRPVTDLSRGTVVSSQW